MAVYKIKRYSEIQQKIFFLDAEGNSFTGQNLIDHQKKMAPGTSLVDAKSDFLKTRTSQDVLNNAQKVEKSVGQMNAARDLGWTGAADKGATRIANQLAARQASQTSAGFKAANATTGSSSSLMSGLKNTWAKSGKLGKAGMIGAGVVGAGLLAKGIGSLMGGNKDQ